MEYYNNILKSNKLINERISALKSKKIDFIDIDNEVISLTSLIPISELSIRKRYNLIEKIEKNIKIIDNMVFFIEKKE